MTCLWASKCFAKSVTKYFLDIARNLFLSFFTVCNLSQSVTWPHATFCCLRKYWCVVQYFSLMTAQFFLHKKRTHDNRSKSYHFQIWWIIQFINKLSIILQRYKTHILDAGFALQHPPCNLVKGEADVSFTKAPLPPWISLHCALKHACTYAQTFSKTFVTPLFLASLPHSPTTTETLHSSKQEFNFTVSVFFFFLHCSLDTHTSKYSTQSHHIYQSFYNIVCLTTCKHTARRANQSNVLS